MKKIIVISVIFAAFLSCEDKSVIELEEINDESSKSGIVYFESGEDYSEAIKLTLKSSSLDERKAWEESKGIVSFGSYCDALYEDVEAENFNSFDDIVKFAEENSKYFQLIEDEKGDFIFA
ncbi:MAG: hypothetical protein PF517_16275 [Salinivirgaceae bacterium]|jgi:hypothetical protein|nr:hypothetical protein [Salinivirgaceae bacterium]